MQRLMIALILLVPAAVSAAPLESRSLLHVLTLNRVDGRETDYDVRVTSLTSGERLASARMSLTSHEAESVTEVGDLRVRVLLTKISGGIAATLEVKRGAMLLDSIQSQWRLVPVFALNVPRVGGDVKAPLIIRKVEPSYPDEAKQAKISGIVIVEALIDKAGVVKDVHVLKPLPNGLSEAAVSAVRQWSFRPGTLDGEPVDVVFNLTVNFALNADQ